MLATSTHISVYERFLDLSAWTASGCSVTTGPTSPAKGPYMLTLAKASSGTQATATRPAALPTTSGAWEWFAYVPTGMHLRVSLLDASSGVLGYVDLNAGTLTWVIGSTTVASTTYTQASYRHFTMRLFADGTMRLFAITGNSDPTGDFPPIGSASAWSGTVDTIKVETLGTTTGTAYLGQLVVHDATYAAEGDSITAGHGAEYDPNPAYTYTGSWTWDEYGSFPYQLGHLLGDRWIINRSVGGSSIGERNARFANVLALKPSVLIIGPPVAAILRSDSPATIESTIAGWIAAALAAGIKVVLCETTPGTGFSSTVNAWLDAQANGTTVLTAATGSVSSSNLRDGTHFWTAGYTEIAAKVAAMVPTLLAAAAVSDHVALTNPALGGDGTVYERRVAG